MTNRAQLPVELPVPYCAFLTDDPEAIINFAADGADCCHGSALITLVDINGGAARSLGAQMAVRGDGGFCGYISGGCVEAAVAAEAISAIRAGSDRFLRLGEGSPFFDITLPCGGGITLSIHVIKDVSPLRQLLENLGNRKSTALRYVPGHQSIHTVKTPFEPGGWNGDCFTRHFRPRLRLILVGQGIELEVTKNIAIAADIEVYAFDRRSMLPSTLEIDEETAIVLLFHDLDAEISTFKQALQKKAFYIGALGSSKTHEKRRLALAQLGYASTDINRIRGPVGMFGPTRDAQSLALSVLADVSWTRDTNKPDERPQEGLAHHI